MSDQLAPDPSLALTITPTHSDLGHFARLATRRLRQRFFVVGALLSVAAGLALSDGDAGPFVSGMIAGVLGVALLISSMVLHRQVAHRLPSMVRESRPCDIDDEGIRMRGSTWATEYTWAAFRKADLTRHLVLLPRERGAPGLVLPRSAFSSEQEAAFVAILVDRGLLTERAAARRS